MRVGISIFPPGSGCSFFSNGLYQNLIDLALCLRAAGHEPIMINGSLGPHIPPESLPPEARDIPFVFMHEVVDSIDVLIQAGAQVSAEDVAKVHARGGKAVAFKGGNDLLIDAERTVHNEPAGAIMNGAVFDEVWTTTQHLETCGAYWEILYRCPVVVLPHIWSPVFVDAVLADLRRVGVPVGYRPREKKRIIILEPNIQTLKTCHIPMLACEHAWRRRPELIDRVTVTNSIHLRKRLPFETFVGALDMCKAKAADGMPVCSFESRYNTPWILSQHGDIVVSHQQIAVPNYSHYDVLHMGYPLVHNVPALRDAGVGYFYPGYDAIEGGNALVSALLHYDEARVLKQEAADAFMQNVYALQPENIRAHARALEALCSRS